METALCCKSAGELQRLLKIAAVFHQFCSLGQHGAVLLLTVAVGDDDYRLHAEETRSHAYALAVVAASCRHNARQLGLCLGQPVKIDKRSAQLESADGRVVLMLDPDSIPCSILDFGARPATG